MSKSPNQLVDQQYLSIYIYIYFDNSSRLYKLNFARIVYGNTKSQIYIHIHIHIHIQG